MAGRLSDGERPSAAPASTEDRAAQLTRRSPREDRFLPLPLSRLVLLRVSPHP